MKKKSKSLKEELCALLDEEDRRKQVLCAVVDKAIGGDMKAFDAIRDILSEEAAGEEGRTVTIRLGKGMEELAK